MEKFKEKIEPKRIEKPEIQPPEFNIEAFKESKKSFENLTKELLPAIRSHEYNVVVGDDISGRLPTLVIGGLLRKIYKNDMVPEPRVLFFAAGRRETEDEKIVQQGITNRLNKLIKEKKINSNDRALIVTEYVQTGESVTYLARAIKDAGLDCDIATLINCSENNDFLKDNIFRDTKFYSGGRKKKPFFWSSKFLSGVRKKEGRIFSLPNESWRGSDPVREARQEAKKMADYLYQIYD